jgi:hypothetical protein
MPEIFILDIQALAKPGRLLVDKAENAFVAASPDGFRRAFDTERL